MPSLEFTTSVRREPKSKTQTYFQRRYAYVKRAEEEISELRQMNALKEDENRELKAKLEAFNGRLIREKYFGSVDYRDIAKHKDLQIKTHQAANASLRDAKDNLATELRDVKRSLSES